MPGRAAEEAEKLPLRMLQGCLEPAHQEQERTRYPSPMRCEVSRGVKNMNIWLRSRMIGQLGRLRPIAAIMQLRPGESSVAALLVQDHIELVTIEILRSSANTPLSDIF
jgi:hypothetical protein